MDLSVGTFNLLNLARPGEPFYPDDPAYTDAEFNEKADWIGGQLRRMDADLVGFQEVFHEDALRNVCARSGRFNGATVVAPGADGVSGPKVGLATRLPLLEPATSITEFPPGLDTVVDGIALPVGSFSRPVLRARVRLTRPAPPAGAGGAPRPAPEPVTVTVFVAHLKSKRPILPPDAVEHDAKEEALGKARALVRRAAEATALRFLVLEEVTATARPVIVVGDLNDGATAVTTDIITGDAPSRFWPREREIRERYWDRLLYSAYEINARRIGRDISYSHIFNGRYETLDHILVSEEFVDANPDRIGEVTNLRYYNDHLVDSRISDERVSRAVSDHAQLVAEIRLR